MSRTGARYLVSLPVASCRAFAELKASRAHDWYAASDPVGVPLGSAGGSVHLLREAWIAEGEPGDLLAWVTSRPTVMVHGSGQSRRLPAYAPSGKPLVPMPVLRGSYGQRLDQTLLDLQTECLDAIIARSPHVSPLLISSGDVLVLPGTDREPLPDADIVALGIRAAPSVATHFGVFVRRRGSLEIETVLQKPSAEDLARIDASREYLVDVGVWVLGPRAIGALLSRCCAGRAESPSAVLPCDLYADVGRALGRSPSDPDTTFSSLSSVVVEITEGAFYHFGTSRQLIENTCALQNDSLLIGRVRGPRAHPDQILQNARIDSPTRRSANHTLWVENSIVPDSWVLRHSHVITGVPDNAASLALDIGVCLDLVPVLGGGLCLRPYGLDDPFQGPVGAPDTLWFGRSLVEWFDARGLSLDDAGIEHDCDVQCAPLFPVIPDLGQGSLLDWMVAAEPAQNARMREQWLNLPRLSAADLLTQADVAALVRSRRARMAEVVQRLYQNRAFSAFYLLDLGATGGLTSDDVSPQEPDPEAAPISRMYDWAWIGAVRRVHGGDVGSAEQEAFSALREGILEEVLQTPVEPHCTVLADQLVWARSPVRLDLAGGWTDTPPYCILHGGRVANVAVNLNGQPPIQCFVRVTDTPEIVLHSIDRGDTERVHTYSDLDAFSHPGSSFAIAKAALSLVGFLPRFASDRRRRDDLADRLERFGGGLEMSVLAAVPQGSGLGTSSILGATILAALADVCGLSWDLGTIVNRTLALEQLMTTGGGWQDQAGAVWHGAKLVESVPGLHQHLTIRWLPHDALTSGCALLYYTGLTRLAKGILEDIVHGLFLNERERLRIIDRIGQNALAAAEALERCDEARLGDVLATSWDLNQALDADTNPPAVEAILAQVRDSLRGAKLLGAGGGGYLLMLAKDAECAHRIRRELTERPPNDRARFVAFDVSTTGLEVTRS